MQKKMQRKMQEEIHPIIRKILYAEHGTFIIFFIHGCKFCDTALQFLHDNNLTYKGYNIDDIPGGMNKLLDVLRRNAQLIYFNPHHHTKPIIFLNGKFLGGRDDLINYVQSRNHNMY
jgi:glutaredoxin